MAKIIVTTLNGKKVLVDTNSKFEISTKSDLVLVTTGERVGIDLYLQPIRESMEEIRKLIKESEAEDSNAKLDLILKNLEKIMKALKIR